MAWRGEMDIFFFFGFFQKKEAKGFKGKEGCWRGKSEGGTASLRKGGVKFPETAE